MCTEFRCRRTFYENCIEFDGRSGALGLFGNRYCEITVCRYFHRWERFSII